MRTAGHILLTAGFVCLLLTVCQMIGAFDSGSASSTALAERIASSLKFAVIGGLALLGGVVMVLADLVSRCCRRSQAGDEAYLHPTISSTERW